MAENRKIETDQLNKDHSSKITKGATTGLKMSIGGVMKGASFVARTTIKLTIKIIRKVITCFFSSLVATGVIILLVCAVLSALVISSAISMTNETNTKQEAPELTKAFLNTNKDRFKEKIYDLVQDKDFNSYVLGGEFDNAYTKLIYGGTPAYSQKELKGYIKGEDEDLDFIKYTEDGKKYNKIYKSLDKLINDISSNSISEMKSILSSNPSSVYPGLEESTFETILDYLKEKGKNKKNDALNWLEEERESALDEIDDLIKDGEYAKCTSLLQALQKYKTKYNLKDENIQINDEYLKGYEKASLYNTEQAKNENAGENVASSSTLPFNQWINNSYYVIPYYYHVNMARHSKYKNRIGGTLTDSMKVLETAAEIFGADVMQTIGVTCLGISAADYAVGTAKYETYKKVSNAFNNGFKNKKKRNKIANKIIDIIHKKDQIRQGVTATVGAGVYGAGVVLKADAIGKLLKYIANNPDLQFGLPNWNVDSGNWQFMTNETQDVKKYPLFYNKSAPMVGTLARHFSYYKDYKNGLKHLPIWNTQDPLISYLYSGNNDYAFNLGAIDAYTNPQYFQNMSYKQILKTGFTALRIDEYWGDFDVDQNNDICSDFYGYPAQGVFLGYKQDSVESGFDSAWNEFWGYDGLYDYYGFSKFACASISAAYGKKKTAHSDYAGFKRNLYIHNWEDYAPNGTKLDIDDTKDLKKETKTNYSKYLSKVNDINKVSNREYYDKTNKDYYSINNKLVDTLREQFANYFINQIYYTYSDNIYDKKDAKTDTGGGSDYIRDWFLDDNVDKKKKIEFLSRSFHAMASGSSYTYRAQEEYDIRNGAVINKMNGHSVGRLELNSKIKVNKINKISTNCARVTSSKTESVDTRGQNVNNQVTYYNIEKDDESGPWYDSKTYAGYIGSLGPSPFVFKNPSDTEVIERLNDKYWPDINVVNLTRFNSEGFNSQEYVVEYGITIQFKNPNSKKWSNIKAILELSFEQKDSGNLKPKYKIVVDDVEEKYSKLFKNHVKWDKEFYEIHKEDIDNGNYSFEVNMNKTFDLGVWSKPSISTDKISVKTISKIVNGELDGQYPLYAKMTGERDIVMDYNTAGFLSYDIDEEKDEKDNVTGVTALVYMKLPDVDMETRLAYMWEKEGMIENSVKLLKIYDEQKNLKDAETKVDLDQLIINYKASEEVENVSLNGANNSSLPKMINNEMIEGTFRIQKEKGVPASSTFAQIILESRGDAGKGLSTLAYKYKNIVGMKVSTGRDPKTKKLYRNGKVLLPTKEGRSDGTLYSTKDWFSTYPSYTNCLLDRGDQLTNPKRPYAGKTRPFLNKNIKKYTKKKAQDFIRAVDAVGYSTSGAYASSCFKIMNQYNLYVFDNMTLEEFQNGYCNGGSLAGPDKIDSIVNMAKQQHGKMYERPPRLKYDGTTVPDTFDCSSLVMFALWAGGGVKNIGNSTEDQPNNLSTLCESDDNKKIKKTGKIVNNRDYWVERIKTPKKKIRNNDLQKGDIVYYKGHVVIYSGNNKQVHASKHYEAFKYKNGKKFWTRDIVETTFQGTSNATYIFRFHFITNTTNAAKQSLNKRMKWLFNGRIPTSQGVMNKYVTKITVPIYNNGKISKSSLTVHKKLAEEIKMCFQEMTQIKFPIHSCACYCWRPMRGGNSLSAHAYACAIDINASENGGSFWGNKVNSKYYFGTSKGKQAVKIWKKHGFYWGGDWTSPNDPMHFTYTNH